MAAKMRRKLGMQCNWEGRQGIVMAMRRVGEKAW